MPIDRPAFATWAIEFTLQSLSCQSAQRQKAGRLCGQKVRGHYLAMIARQAMGFADSAETQRLTALRALRFANWRAMRLCALQALAALALIGSAGVGRWLWPCVLRCNVPPRVWVCTRASCVRMERGYASRCAGYARGGYRVKYRNDNCFTYLL